MLDFEILTKLETCLKNTGFEYDFSIDNNHFFDCPYGKYTSLTLRSVTGLINNSILNNDSEHSSYDIELINKLTKCLLDSNDEELKSIAWNSFIDCAYDQKFLLFKEMEEARNSFFDQIEEDCCTNHTKMLESERLYIKPNNKEDGRSIYEYVNKYDKDEYLLARMARNCGSEDYFLFCLCLKETNEIIQMYPSISEATRQTNINNISTCLNGRQKTAGGFKWKYVNTESRLKEKFVNTH